MAPDMTTVLYIDSYLDPYMDFIIISTWHKTITKFWRRDEVSDRGMMLRGLGIQRNSNSSFVNNSDVNLSLHILRLCWLYAVAARSSGAFDIIDLPLAQFTRTCSSFVNLTWIVHHPWKCASQCQAVNVTLMSLILTITFIYNWICKLSSFTTLLGLITL